MPEPFRVRKYSRKLTASFLSSLSLYTLGQSQTFRPLSFNHKSSRISYRLAMNMEVRLMYTEPFHQLSQDSSSRIKSSMKPFLKVAHQLDLVLTLQAQGWDGFKLHWTQLVKLRIQFFTDSVSAGEPMVKSDVEGLLNMPASMSNDEILAKTESMEGRQNLMLGRRSPFLFGFEYPVLCFCYRNFLGWASGVCSRY